MVAEWLTRVFAHKLMVTQHCNCRMASNICARASILGAGTDFSCVPCFLSLFVFGLNLMPSGKRVALPAPVAPAQGTLTSTRATDMLRLRSSCATHKPMMPAIMPAVMHRVMLSCEQRYCKSQQATKQAHTSADDRNIDCYVSITAKASNAAHSPCMPFLL